MRLRALTEAECYERCYGWRGQDDDVHVLPRGASAEEGVAVLTERIRLAFEARLEQREPEAA